MNLQITKEKVLEAASKCSTAKETLKTLFPEVFNLKITERVKSFEDACAIKGISVSSVFYHTDTKDIIAYKKLVIIVSVLNEGWTPDWKDSNQYKYYPYFSMTSSGFGFSYTLYGTWSAATVVGSRLCFKSSELSEYAGKKFGGIYNDFLN
jgi:hypothetical protein